MFMHMLLCIYLLAITPMQAADQQKPLAQLSAAEIELAVFHIKGEFNKIMDTREQDAEQLAHQYNSLMQAYMTGVFEADELLDGLQYPCHDDSSTKYVDTVQGIWSMIKTLHEIAYDAITEREGVILQKILHNPYAKPEQRKVFLQNLGEFNTFDLQILRLFDFIENAYIPFPEGDNDEEELKEIKRCARSCYELHERTEPVEKRLHERRKNVMGNRSALHEAMKTGDPKKVLELCEKKAPLHLDPLPSVSKLAEEMVAEKDHIYAENSIRTRLSCIGEVFHH